MNRRILVPLLLLAGVAAGLYFYPGSESPPPPVALPERAASPPEPRYPVPSPTPAPDTPSQPAADAPQTQPPAPAPQPAPSPLPQLGQSDSLARTALQEMFAVADALRLFQPDGLIRRLVVTIDNLPRARLPHKQLAVENVPGRFLVSGNADDGYFINPENYRRYSPYVSLLEALDIETFVQLYVRYYPLLQRAYVELGYPDAYFNDRLVVVIDHLLTTPEVERPVRLVRPHVLYKYADPELEALSAGQKAMIRMGPDNAARVRAVLRELRKRLVDLAPARSRE